jgi:hypothetical protein
LRSKVVIGSNGEGHRASRGRYLARAQKAAAAGLGSRGFTASLCALHPQYIPNCLNRHPQLPQHKLGIKPQHPIPKPLKHPSAPSISGNTLRMVRTVNFDYQIDTRCQEIRHVAIANDHLPAKRDPQLLAPDGGP